MRTIKLRSYFLSAFTILFLGELVQVQSSLPRPSQNIILLTSFSCGKSHLDVWTYPYLKELHWSKEFGRRRKARTLLLLFGRSIRRRGLRGQGSLSGSALRSKCRIQCLLTLSLCCRVDDTFDVAVTEIYYG